MIHRWVTFVLLGSFALVVVILFVQEWVGPKMDAWIEEWFDFSP